jgi:hypothetical protein
MKKVVFYFLLVITLISCRSVQKTTDQEKTVITTEQVTKTVLDGTVTQEATDKEVSNTSAQIIDNNSTMTIAPIDPMKPSIYTDPATGKQMTFQNSSIIFKRETKRESIKKKVETEITAKNKTVNRKEVQSSQEATVKKEKRTAVVSKQGGFPAIPFSMFVLGVLASVAFFKRKTILALLRPI